MIHICQSWEAEHEEKKRIVGGWEVEDRKRWNFLVHITFTVDGEDGPEDSSCGGTIIDKYWILTAAHCLR